MLLRIFGIKDEPLPESEQVWKCPTCGHPHPLGAYRLGRVVDLRREAVEDYVEGRISVEELERRIAAFLAQGARR